MADLDAIKSRYGFRELKVATWKDPKLSVHPFRGGPKPASVSPELVSKPFASYKVRIRKPPEPTDDEESNGDDNEDKEEETKSESPVDSPLESEAPPAETNDPESAPPTEDIPPPDSEIKTPSASIEQPTAESSLPVTEAPPSENDQPENVQQDGQEDPEASKGEAQGDNEVAPSAGDDKGDDSAAMYGEQSQPQEEQLTEGIFPPPAFEPPQLEEHHENTVEVTEAPLNDTAVVDVVSEPPPPLDEPAIDVPPPAPEPPAEGSGNVGPVMITEALQDGDKSPKIVQFAPGTPEPKPTHRKKKSAKGTKGKRKKTFVPIADTDVPLDTAAAALVAPPLGPPAQVDESAPPPLEPTENGSKPNEEPLPESEVKDPDPILPELSDEARNEPVPKLIEAVDAPGAFPDEHHNGEKPEQPSTVEEESLPEEKLKKQKKGSKKSSQEPVPLEEPEPAPVVKERQPVEIVPPPAEEPRSKSKDKKKKKSSKSKSKEKDLPPPPPPIPAGLGIDFSDIPPPPGDPLPDIPTPDDVAQERQFEPNEEIKQDDTEIVGETPANEAGQDPSADVQPVPPDSMADPPVEANGTSAEGDISEEASPNIEAPAEADPIPESVGEKVYDENPTVDESRDTQEAMKDENDETVKDDTDSVHGDGVSETPDSAVIVEEPGEGAQDLAEKVVVDAADEKNEGGTADEIEEVTMEEAATDDLVETQEPGAESSNPPAPVEDVPVAPSEQDHGGDLDDDDVSLEDSVSDGNTSKELDGASESCSNPEKPAQAVTGALSRDGDKDGPEPESVEIEEPVKISASTEDAIVEPESTPEDLPGSFPGESQADGGDGVTKDDTPNDNTADAMAIEPNEAVETSQAPSEPIHAGENAVDDVLVQEPTTNGPNEPTADINAGETVSDGEPPSETTVTDLEIVEEAEKAPEEPLSETVADLVGEDSAPGEPLASEAPIEEPSPVEEPAPVEDPSPLIEEAANTVEEPVVRETKPTPDAPKEEETIPEPEAVPETEIVQPSAIEEVTLEIPNDPEPILEAPPSPHLSKGSGSKGHWERQHKKRSLGDSKKSSDKSRSKKRSSREKDEPQARERSHKTARVSLTADELARRHRKTEERREAERARFLEQERLLAEEAELRRIRHEARRAARKAAAEEAVRIAKEEAEDVARKEAERRRRRREERPHSRRDSKSSSSIPKIRGFSFGESIKSNSVRTSNYSSSKSSSRDKDRPSIIEELPPREEEPMTGPSSRSREEGSSSHHRRRRHHRSEGERPEGRRRESHRDEGERRSHRSSTQQKESRPKSFLGSLLKAF